MFTNSLNYLTRLSLVVSLSLPWLHSASAEDSAFASFKLNGVETDCVIERIEEDAFWGRADVGPGGGVAITEQEARDAYKCAWREMRDGYAKSDHPIAARYADWKLFSNTPYISENHGNRYVNNHANEIAAPLYKDYEQAAALPVGSILTKDAFVVNKNGRVVFGALQTMEKMPPGFNPESFDWRYSLILPDGRMFGTTGGDGSATVKFCHECHNKQLEHTANPLLFLPDEYRVR